MTNTILDIIHRPLSYLKHKVSETEFCVRHQVEPPDRRQTSTIHLVKLNRFHLKTETEFSVRNVVL
jgi:hypothetical protein